MAKASFFVNHLKVRKKGEFLILEAQKQCQHGTVLDEVFLTVPTGLAPFFTHVEDTQDATSLWFPNEQSKTLAKRFKRFSGRN